MAGKKQKPKKKAQHRKQGGVMGMSQIPYAQRLKAQRQEEVGFNRELAARAIMYAYSWAFNEIRGIGFERLVRYNEVFQRYDDEFYGQEIELSLDQAKRRLASMGMEISGELLVAPRTVGMSRKEWEMKTHMMQAAQGAMLCGDMAANDVFGFGGETLLKIHDRVEELTARYAKEGIGFLLKKMRKLGFVIEGDHAVAYLVDGKPQKKWLTKKELEELGDD